MTQINSFGFNTGKIEEDPVPAPAPVVKNVVSSVNEKIDNIIKNGGSAEITNSGAKEFNEVYDRYKKERRAKIIKISFDDNSKTITVTNLQSSNDTEL